MRRRRRISKETATVLELFLDAPEQARFGRGIILDTGLKSGSLYPILHRLEDRDLLESRWEDLDVAVEEGRRPRRLYKLRARMVGEARKLLEEHREKPRLHPGAGIGGVPA